MKRLISIFLKKISIRSSTRLTFCFLFVFIPFFKTLNAQNKRQDLELKRQKLLQQIDNTNKRLQVNQQYQMAAEDQLEVLQDQIETREALINNLNEEIITTDSIISRTEEVLIALNDDMQRLRSEYSLMLRKAYRSKVPNNGMAFLMSSKNFDNAYKRWQYFKQYEKFKKRQAQLIVQTQKSLAAKNAFLNQQKIQKEILATTNRSQMGSLAVEKQSKDKLIEQLKNEKSKLSKELKSQEKKTAQLNSAIENLIAAELEAKRKAAEERARKAQEEAARLEREAARRRRKQNKNESATEGVAEVEKPKAALVLTESAENLSLSSDFRSNRGKLPAPAAGNIVRGFGKQKVLDKVTAVNNGIDIRTAQNATVHAVFNGTVSVVSNIPGLGYVVLVQHGNYYTVYSGLASVSVKKGESITTQQNIGHAGINSVSNEPEVHFEVWLEKTQLNPTSWLAK